MSRKSHIICYTCVNEQEKCADCRGSDYRPSITWNCSPENMYRYRDDIPDDTCTAYRRSEAEKALKAASVLQVIQAQQKGIEEANKAKEEEKAKKAEMEKLRAKQVEDLYRSRITFPPKEEKPFDFASAPKKIWTEPPQIPSPFDGLSAGVEEVKHFKVTSSLYPDHVWTINARTEYHARLWVARYVKISFSETQIV